MSEDRANLARQQNAALQSILKNVLPPPGLLPEQLAHTADTLLSKRRREASLCIPLVTAHLGESFVERFNSFAATHIYPSQGGPLADAAKFASSLLAAGLTFPPAPLREIILLRARHGLPIQLHKYKKPTTLYLTFRFRSRIRIFRLFLTHSS